MRKRKAEAYRRVKSLVLGERKRKGRVQL
jgi:hypothetical protein